jgi:WD40 repeat protein
MDIGDADNMGDNEIVLAVTNLGSPIILKHIDNAWVPQDVQKTTVSAIDVAKIRDLDGILGNGNEIIASGNNNKLMVWKFEGGSYQFKSISGDLGGFTQGVDAGDVDGDGSNEIATAATGIPTSVLYVFRYEAENASGAFQEICRMTIDGGTGQLRTVDLDNNGRSEIALENNGLSIFEFAAGTLVKRFNCIFGEYFENVWRNR